MKRREFVKNTAAGLAGLATAATMAKERRYKVAVIGRTGKGNYGHRLDVVWNDIDQAEIVAVADEDAKGRAAAAGRLKAPGAYADYRRMLDKERPQIVSVAPRWLDCHRDMVLACAEFGCHVFLEKPMCQTLKQADEMVAAFEKKGLKLAIAHQTRYSPSLRHVERLVSDAEVSGWESAHSPQPHEAGNLKLDCSKAHSRLGWRQRWSLDTALQKTMEWHMAWRRGQDVQVLALSQIADFEQAKTNRQYEPV